MRLLLYRFVVEDKYLKEVVMAIDKPRTNAEISTIANIHRVKVSKILRILRREGIVKRLSGLYGLTQEGQEIRKRIVEQEGKVYEYNEPENFDWQTFYEIKRGYKQKGAVLKALKERKGLTEHIRETALKYNNNLSYANTSRILKWLCRKGLAKSTAVISEDKHGRRFEGVAYEITNKGTNMLEHLQADTQA